MFILVEYSLNGSCTKVNPFSLGELNSVYCNPVGKGVFVIEIRLVSRHGFENVTSKDSDTLSVYPVVPVTVIV